MDNNASQIDVSPTGSSSAAGFKTLGGPVRATAVGQRLDAYLATEYPFFSRAIWQKRIESQEVKVGMQDARASYRLRLHDQIYMYHPESREPAVDTNVKVIYRDGPVLAAFKPAGLPMHEGGPFRKNTFARVIAEVAGNEWSAVHRLDKETSGLVLCGADEATRMKLTTQLRKGQMRKEYQAIVNGVPAQDHWYVDGPLGDLKESAIRIKSWVVPDGLPALTEFMLEKASEEFSLIRAFPRTGRTNQIRIHAAYSGHPLVGDKLYHPDESIFLEYWDHGMSDALAERAGHWRCLLHAAALTFAHPNYKDPVRVECPWPEDFKEAYKRYIE